MGEEEQLEQGFEEDYTQQLKEGNIFRLKLSDLLG